MIKPPTPAVGPLGYGLDADDLVAFHALMHDTDTICFAPLVVSAFGRQPA